MPKPTDREKLVDAVHGSRARLRRGGDGGKVWIVGPISVPLFRLDQSHAGR